MPSEERRCWDCEHWVGYATEHPECERLDDMDCICNGRMNFVQRAVPIPARFRGNRGRTE